MNSYSKMLLFDYDGTIVNSELAILNGIKYALNYFNCSIPTDEVLRKNIGKPLLPLFSEYTGNPDPSFHNKLLEKYRSWYMDASQKEEIYGSYMDDRLSGKTDAYGNPMGGWRKETIKHRKADGTMTAKEVWMGGNDNEGVQPKSETQILQENVTASKKDQAAEEQADYSKKKRLSVKSSRSLFANEGGRGFFN